MNRPGMKMYRTCAWLFGEAAAQRLVAPLVADLQEELSRASHDPAAQRLARRAAWVGLLRVVPHLAWRSTPESALGGSLFPAVAAGLGLAGLWYGGEAPANSSTFAALQLKWMLLALAAGLLARRAAARLWALPGWSALGLGLVALLPVWIVGQRWVSLGSWMVDWAELSRPALLVAGAALARQRSWGLAALLLGGTATAVYLQDVAGALLLAGMGAALLSCVWPRHYALGAGLALGGVGAFLAAPPWLWEAGAALPPHTDGALLTLAAELGEPAAGLALLALGMTALLPLRAGAPRELGRGVAVLVLLQMGLHLGTLAGLLPPLGVPLPLLSYGGAALLSIALTLGLSVPRATPQPLALAR